MLQDSKILPAITSIKQRSERESDQERLVRSFVDAGIKPLLENNNNQIVYGRRGTGKTHLLKVLDPANFGHSTVPLYIDARTLGSSTQFSDPSQPLRDRCLSLFRDIFTEVYEALLAYLVDPSSKNVDQGLDALDAVMNSVMSPVQHTQTTAIESTSETDNSSVGKIDAKLSSKPALGASSESTSKSVQTTKTNVLVSEEDKVVFPELQVALKKFLKTVDIRLLLLLDEWSSIPIDLQPFLAEFLKRSVLPNADITIKIASLEYRSQFSIRDGTGLMIGFELGADISANLDIDDYYVFDRNPNGITDIFAKILYRHLEPDLGEYLIQEYDIKSGFDFVDSLFVSRDVFRELVRAAEGVVRDLINIFTNAAIHAKRRQRTTIDRAAILDAARQWYEQDKVKELGEDLRTILEAIIKDVIGQRQARAFLIPRDLEKHPVIQKLFDARVLHLMQRGYADKDNPGQRYNIYSIDYGTYVDLLGTRNAPKTQFSRSQGPEFVVPFDDKRSIRRIILPRAILDG